MISTELLRRFPFFAELTEGQLHEIAMIAEEFSYPPKTIIFKEGEEACCLYLVVEGDVELLSSGGEEGNIVDTYVGCAIQGEVFSISTMVPPYRLTASARSEGAVKAIGIQAADLRAMCEADYHLGYILMQHLAQALVERLRIAHVQLAISKPK